MSSPGKENLLPAGTPPYAFAGPKIASSSALKTPEKTLGGSAPAKLRPGPSATAEAKIGIEKGEDGHGSKRPSPVQAFRVYDESTPQGGSAGKRARVAPLISPQRSPFRALALGSPDSNLARAKAAASGSRGQRAAENDTEDPTAPAAGGTDPPGADPLGSQLQAESGDAVVPASPSDDLQHGKENNWDPEVNPGREAAIERDVLGLGLEARVLQSLGAAELSVSPATSESAEAGSPLSEGEVGQGEERIFGQAQIPPQPLQGTDELGVYCDDTHDIYRADGDMSALHGYRQSLGSASTGESADRQQPDRTSEQQ